MADDIRIDITSDNESAPALKAAKSDIQAVGDAAAKAAPQIKGAGDSFDSLGDAAKKSTKSTDDQASRLDKVGESADNTEGKFTGLASGIDGVTSIMDDPSPQEFAQGLADMADGAANFLVPALKSAGNAVSSMLQRVTGASTGIAAMGRVAGVAAGAAAIGALIFATNQMAKAAREAKVKELADDFIATGESAAIAAFKLDENLSTAADLHKTFDKLLDTNPVLAGQFIRLAESQGVNEKATGAMRQKLEEATATQKGLAEATDDARSAIEIEADEIAAFNAEVDKMLGKTFGLTEAQANLTLAVADAADKIKAEREEHGAKALSLDINTRAGAENILMLEGLVRAEADVVQALRESGASNAQVTSEVTRGKRAIEDQAVAMGFNRSQVQMLTGALNGIPRNVTADIRIRGKEQSIGDIGKIQKAINNLRGRDVGIRIVGTSVGVVLPGGAKFYAHGGISGAAAGGARGGMMWTGEQGPELVQLPFGSKVNTAGDSRRMAAGMGMGMGMGGGGGVTHIHNWNIQGSIRSDRDLIALVRNELGHGGFGGVR